MSPPFLPAAYDAQIIRRRDEYRVVPSPHCKSPQFLEDKAGTLEAGERADIAIWDSNLYAVPSEELKDIKCEITILDGKIVYKDDHSLITADSKKERP